MCFLSDAYACQDRSRCPVIVRQFPDAHPDTDPDDLMQIKSDGYRLNRMQIESDADRIGCRLNRIQIKREESGHIAAVMIYDRRQTRCQSDFIIH